MIIRVFSNEYYLIESFAVFFKIFLAVVESRIKQKHGSLAMLKNYGVISKFSIAFRSKAILISA